MTDYWNYIVTAIGIVGFYFAGKKVWWCWYINILNQILWFTFGVVTEQWGFVVGALIYTVSFSKNAYMWTKEHFEKSYSPSDKPIPRPFVAYVTDEAGVTNFSGSQPPEQSSDSYVSPPLIDLEESMKARREKHELGEVPRCESKTIEEGHILSCRRDQHDDNDHYAELLLEGQIHGDHIFWSD